MIELRRGNIFAVKADALVVPVNCVGVMGAGLAKEVLRRFPQQCEVYFEACRKRELRPGQTLGAPKGSKTPEGQPELLFAATKNHWRNLSQLDWIADCALTIVWEAQARGLETVAVPALGCGLGNIEWGVAEPILSKEFAPFEGTIFLFPPP